MARRERGRMPYRWRKPWGTRRSGGRRRRGKPRAPWRLFHRRSFLEWTNPAALTAEIPHQRNRTSILLWDLLHAAVPLPPASNSGGVLPPASSGGSSTLPSCKRLRWHPPPPRVAAVVAPLPLPTGDTSAPSPLLSPLATPLPLPSAHQHHRSPPSLFHHRLFPTSSGSVAALLLARSGGLAALQQHDGSTSGSSLSLSASSAAAGWQFLGGAADPRRGAARGGLPFLGGAADPRRGAARGGLPNYQQLEIDRRRCAIKDSPQRRIRQNHLIEAPVFDHRFVIVLRQHQDRSHEILSATSTQIVPESESNIPTPKTKLAAQKLHLRRLKTHTSTPRSSDKRGTRGFKLYFGIGAIRGDEQDLPRKKWIESVASSSPLASVVLRGRHGTGVERRGAATAMQDGTAAVETERWRGEGRPVVVRGCARQRRETRKGGELVEQGLSERWGGFKGGISGWRKGEEETEGCPWVYVGVEDERKVAMSVLAVGWRRARLATKTRAEKRWVVGGVGRQFDRVLTDVGVL
uniref:Uncharacterized protein n=1 Tax=Oryza punctata TaxID=4537 RepID=A0A0E0LEG7_ORYPU